MKRMRVDYGVGVGDSSGRSCCEIRRGGDGHAEEDVDEYLSSCNEQDTRPAKGGIRKFGV